jgi:hypothetical protein
LNEVGSSVWGLFDGETSVSQIIDTISGEYEVTRAETEADIIELIGSMEEACLIS